MGVAVYRLWPWRQSVLTGRKVIGIPVLALVVIGLSVLPDMDAAVGIILNNLGRYHNNLVGAPLFGAGVAVGVAALTWRWRRTQNWFTLALVCYQAHILMDYLTVGRGIMLLWPFTTRRFSPPFKLFYGLHWSDGLFAWNHLITLVTEIGFVLLLFIGVRMAVKPRAATTRTSAPLPANDPQGD
jgi:membrane-bound metal-dependent hydrolase YbcI (DUF457 family)